MIEGRVIRSVCCASTEFIKSAGRIRDARLQDEIKRSIQTLLLCALDQPPTALHMHMLKGRQVQSAIDPAKKVNVWTIHVTKNDAYKASFTLEDGTAYMRLIGEHDVIDKHP